MVAFHTVKPGDTLYEVRSERAGNTRSVEVFIDPRQHLSVSGVPNMEH